MEKIAKENIHVNHTHSASKHGYNCNFDIMDDREYLYFSKTISKRFPKDVGDIQSRLIDHRPVVQGEIRYFVREFEEKRGFRESRLLDSLNRMMVEINEQALPKCSEHMHEHLCEALTRLEAANHMSQRIQQRELDAHQSAQLQATIERRTEDWEEFLKEQQRLKEEVDEEHVKAVGRLSTLYSEMKKDLAKLSRF